MANFLSLTVNLTLFLVQKIGHYRFTMLQLLSSVVILFLRNVIDIANVSKARDSCHRHKILDLSTYLQENFMGMSRKVHIVCSSSHAGGTFSLWFTWLIEVASNRRLIFLLHFWCPHLETRCIRPTFAPTYCILTQFCWSSLETSACPQTGIIE